MLQRRGSKAIATIIGGVLLAIAVLALIGLYFYLEYQQREIIYIATQVAKERLNALAISSMLNVSYTYNKASNTLNVTVISRAPRAVILSGLTILWQNESLTIIDRNIKFMQVGATAVLRSLDSTTYVLEGFPIVLSPGDTLTIVINRVQSPLVLTLSLSASPAVVVIPVKPAEKTLGGQQPQVNVSYPHFHSSLLLKPLTGYVVAIKSLATREKGPYLPQAKGLEVVIGQVVGGSASSLLRRDGDLLVIEAQRRSICSNYASWRYMKRIVIINPNPYSYNDIQVRIVLNSSNFDFSHAKNDGSDIRIVNLNCMPLNYWIEKWNPRERIGIIWVKIPRIQSYGNVTILLIYGNPAASRDKLHEGLLKVMTRLPARDGPGYKIEYQEWVAPFRGLIGGGVPKGWHSDDGAWRYTLPFIFPFYNKRITMLWVCSNGFVATYRITDYSDSVWELKRRPMIAPFWEDLMSSGDNHDIFIRENYSDDFGRSVVIRWFTDFFYHHGVANFELVLYENGLIRFNYGYIRGYSYDRPTIGISLGDSIHYTISEYNDRSANELSNANSLIFWPRKKPLREFVLEFGREDLLHKYIVDFSITYSTNSRYARLLRLLANADSIVPFTYDVEVYSGVSLLARYRGFTQNTLNINASLGVFTVGSSLRVRLRTVSSVPYYLVVDQLSIEYNSIEFTSSAIYIASNSSSVYYSYDVSSGIVKVIQLAGFPSTGYTALATDPYNKGIWVARGRILKEYIITNSTWAFSMSLNSPLKAGGFVAFNGTHIYYCPGGGSSNLYILDPLEKRTVSIKTLPYAVTEWSNTVQVGSILYIHTGISGHLLQVNLKNGDVADLGPVPFLKPLGMDYDSFKNSIIFMIQGGGLAYYNLSTGNWSIVAVPLPFYPITPGDRLVIIGDNLYYIRGDSTSEILIMNLSEIGH